MLLKDTKLKKLSNVIIFILQNRYVTKQKSYDDNKQLKIILIQLLKVLSTCIYISV